MTPDETTRVQEIRADLDSSEWITLPLDIVTIGCLRNTNRFLLSLVERQAAEIAALHKQLDAESDVQYTQRMHIEKLTGDPYESPCPASFSGGERFPKPNDVSKL